MNTIKEAFEAVYSIAKTEINLFDFTISLWNIFMFVIFGGLFIWFLKNIFE
jgi:hypothetical protein